LRKLVEDHGYGEKLLLEQAWWPAAGNFNDLHPEYEVQDYRGSVRYIDAALVRGIVKIGFEAVGYGPHCKNVSRWRFGDNLLRDNHLQLDGWRLFYFSIDQLEQNPKQCQQLIQQILGTYFGREVRQVQLSANERDVLRLALRSNSPITPGEVQQLLDCGNRTARTILHKLHDAGILAAAGGTVRVRSYTVAVRNPEWYL